MNRGKGEGDVRGEGGKRRKPCIIPVLRDNSIMTQSHSAELFRGREMRALLPDAGKCFASEASQAHAECLFLRKLSAERGWCARSLAILGFGGGGGWDPGRNPNVLGAVYPLNNPLNRYHLVAAPKSSIRGTEFGGIFWKRLFLGCHVSIHSHLNAAFCVMGKPGSGTGNNGG